MEDSSPEESGVIQEPCGARRTPPGTVEARFPGFLTRGTPEYTDWYHLKKPLLYIKLKNFPNDSYSPAKKIKMVRLTRRRAATDLIFGLVQVLTISEPI